MRFAVFADLLRPITSDEQAALFAAVDKLIPDSGCLGPNRSGDFEMYFRVDAPTQEAARSEAECYMNAVLECANVYIAYALTLQAQH